MLVSLVEMLFLAISILNRMSWFQISWGGNFIHENEIMEKLIMLFSQERDWILDVNSAEGKRILYGVVKTRVKILIPVSYFW